MGTAPPVWPVRHVTADLTSTYPACPGIPIGVWRRRVALRHGLLDGDRALDGVHDAAELGEDSVACRVDDAATVFPNHREDDCLVRIEIADGSSLVSAHERAIAGDIGSEDRCQFARS